MGSYGLGVTRLLAASLEVGTSETSKRVPTSEDGGVDVSNSNRHLQQLTRMKWPLTIAPFDVVVILPKVIIIFSTQFHFSLSLTFCTLSLFSVCLQNHPSSRFFSLSYPLDLSFRPIDSVCNIFSPSSCSPLLPILTRTQLLPNWWPRWWWSWWSIWVDHFRIPSVHWQSPNTHSKNIPRLRDSKEEWRRK